MSRHVFQSPLFERQKKRLTKKEVEALDQAINEIMKKPDAGEPKRSDISGIYVYKCKVGSKLLLVTYEFDDAEIDLLTIGPHENFYRDLKRYLK
ncbi:MAG: type II toxin-antitoxin system RelE/ParE family toxin [Syntrophales bacterium]|jgi:mRNA-degrading endonuclease RelE of RelBE toxin-antitoxin system|nr:type II toxin-antitoxin system RelE/ParE family toxin [Syntrophales bacterium]